MIKKKLLIYLRFKCGLKEAKASFFNFVRSSKASWRALFGHEKHKGCQKYQGKIAIRLSATYSSCIVEEVNMEGHELPAGTKLICTDTRHKNSSSMCAISITKLDIFESQVPT